MRRVYYIYNVRRNIIRGHHAHKELKQILICVKGAVEIALDDGTAKGNVKLDNPTHGLYVGPSTWRTMKWLQDDSILLVLASEHYREADYIRDYAQFIDFAAKDEK